METMEIEHLFFWPE